MRISIDDMDFVNLLHIFVTWIFKW